MRAAAPAFDAIPFAEATRRNCVALRAADGMLLVVLGNPYDLDSQDWIEERLREPFGYRLAHRLAVAAYLSEQETQRSEEHTSELQSLAYLVCRLLLEKKKKK